MFTRLRPTKRKERDNNNSAYSAALSWLTLPSAVVVDHRITGQARKGPGALGVTLPSAGGAYLWGTRRGAQAQVKSLAA